MLASMGSTNKHRLIHFLPDEKVTNNFISMLESIYPNESRYIIIGFTSKPKLTRLDENTEYYTKGSKELERIILNLYSYQKVFLHCLNVGYGYEKIKHPDVNWVIWGGDFYEGLIEHKGYRIYVNDKEQWRVRASSSPIGNIPIWLYKSLVKVRDIICYNKSYKIIKKVNTVIAIEEDYNLLREYYPELNIGKNNFFSYYPIENQIGKDNLDKQCEGLNIWVGNSPALNGNHSTIFKCLKDFPKTVKVYCPISYGERRLIKYVDRIGEEILGENFVPLKEFMEANRYFEKYLDANSFIFGHLRQCGFGSILMALYFGGKCFLFKTSPLYKFLKRNGVVVFSIENDLNYESTQTPLSKGERINNRDFVKSICSLEAIKEQMKLVFS